MSCRFNAVRNQEVPASIVRLSLQHHLQACPAEKHKPRLAKFPLEFRITSTLEPCPKHSGIRMLLAETGQRQDCTGELQNRDHLLHHPERLPWLFIVTIFVMGFTATGECREVPVVTNIDPTLRVLNLKQRL